MEFFPSHQVFIKIGSFELRWYAFLIMTGALLAYYLTDRRRRKAGYDSDLADDLFVGCLSCGIIGARLWYVLFSDLSSYLADPISIIRIWEGGLAIHGAVLGGVAFIWLYARKHHYSVIHITDILLPNVLLAQAIGRWGNFANFECYGPEVEESFFDGILSFIKKDMYINGAYRMPMFFFESVLCVLGLILIRLYQMRKGVKRGDGTFGYMVWYGATRFWIEKFRTDSLMIGPFKMAQVVSIIALLIGLAGMLGAFDKWIKSKKPLLVFDNDGTILDTEDCITRSFDIVLKKHVPGIVLTEEDYAGFLGPTLKESFEKYAPGQNTDRLIAEYREINRQMHFQGAIKPMKNVPELLEYLKNEGYDMVIGSSKKAETVRLGLEVCGLEKYFDTIIGVEDVKKYKPDKETIVKSYQAKGYSMANCIYVGDSGSDVECARNAGVFAIALCSNELKRDELKKAKPNKLIDDMAEIKEILKEDHPWTYNMM